MTDKKSSAPLTAAICGLAIFMVALDNLIVTTALPTIRIDLKTGMEGLQWTTNGYTLTFAVLLLTAATVADRYGRRLLFAIGLAIFTGASAACAMAPGIEALVAARTVQGVGAAITAPLTLTLIAAAVPPARRGAALGIWGAISGLGIALGPLIGGAIIEHSSWSWIFWINVPTGVLLLICVPLLTESRRDTPALDLPGTVLATGGLFGVVLGLIRGNDAGWSSVQVIGSLIGGAVLLAAFAAWELRASAPMLPMRLFRNRGFSATNTVGMLMGFGTLGAVFLLAQFLQTVQGGIHHSKPACALWRGRACRSSCHRSRGSSATVSEAGSC
jgi:EmrB/QacA subfamily drug resistance transporter